MEYHEAVNTLERLRRLGTDLGTETTASLLSQVGNPQDGLPAVQIAGSNGKGSTARTLERILREAGLEVGLYTSPDLNDLRERIRVQGQKIPKHAVVEFVEEVQPYVVDQSREESTPTFFETFTSLALWYFDRREVDVAVLEVGIGGRYDATSVVDPIAAAVTNVSLEHTDLLGSSIEEIARDKVQVAPTDRPLVTGATGSALDVIRDETEVVTVGHGATDVVASEGEMVSLTESTLSLVGRDWDVQTSTPLLGEHQAVNVGIAATLARQVANPSEEEIAAGIRNVHWPGRFEVMEDTPFVVLDGAHNPDACATLATLLDRFDYDDLHLVFGAMRDKDHERMRQSLPDVERAYLAEPAVDRAQNTTTLASVFSRNDGIELDQYDSVLDALGWALETADENDCVLVTGSLYTVGEARDYWTRAPMCVTTDTVERAQSRLRDADVPPLQRRETADDIVSRTVRFHTRREFASTLKELMLKLGGSCATSGIETADQHVDVVLSGSLQQFEQLVGRLRRLSKAGEHLADQLERRLNGTVPLTDEYPWGDDTAVMGILNVTPDSFHDGGAYNSLEAAVSRAEEMVEAGADIVDVGGESTRPGADPISTAEECERVVPVIERLDRLDAMVSVDTRKPDVAEAALEAGADMINDVTGLEDAAMRRVVAEWDVPVVVMHSLSAPVNPDRDWSYDSVVDDVLEELTERVLLAERAGIDRSQIVVDPGLGFGKGAVESFRLLDRLEAFQALGTSVLVGHSHKSMFQRVGCDAGERHAPTVAATALAVERGADVVRVHNVAANVAAIGTAEMVSRSVRADER